MICNKIVASLEALSPSQYACSWDNVGLLVGSYDSEVKKVLIALDVTNNVIDYAINNHVDLLVTHHPLIFGALKQINNHDYIGGKVLKLAENHISYFAMHTNFDVKGGMAELAGDLIQLKQMKPLELIEDTEEGIGRIGFLQQEMSLQECAAMVKSQFQLKHVSVFGELNKSVNRAAISPGSGKSMITYALQAKADVLITGDIGHHEGLDAIEQDLCIIDAGHYGLEHIFIDFIKDYLKNRHKEQLEILTYHNGSPFQIQ